MVDELTIRRAVPEDAEAICALHRASIRELCAVSYTPAQIEAWVKPLEPLRYHPAMDKFEFHVAETGGEVVGFSILDPEGAELNAVYLHPAHVGRGYGRRLVGHSERLAREKSIVELKLKSTLNAVGFYEACGYERLGDGIHTNPMGLELPCVEMRKKL